MTTAEIDHGPILDIALDEIRPATVNELVYRPIDPEDPDNVKLAESIARHGVLTPLVLTTDHVILDGHRRYCAARVAGLAAVPCRVAAVHSGEERFISLLIEYNSQRVKGIDEVLHEELIRSNSEDAYMELVLHREEAARRGAGDVTPIQLKGRKARAKITKAKIPMFNAIADVLNARRPYWPLSDRQIHYALLNAPPLIHASKPDSTYRNDAKSYTALTELLTRARIVEWIPWECIEDPTRPQVPWDVFASPGPYIKRELDSFLLGYQRDFQASQPNHIEIIGEKNTVQSTIRPVASRYTIPYTIGRGYCSIDPRHELAERFRRSGKERLVLLILADFDPDGESIAESFACSMRDDFGVKDILPVKVALTYEQVGRYELPFNTDVKKKSSKAKAFIKKYGEAVYELESLPPDLLQELLDEAILKVMDIDLFNAEVAKEKEDAAFLDARRRALVKFMGMGEAA